MSRPITDGELQEYVDGGLDEERRAEIAAFLWKHPEKAAEVRRLNELNRALCRLGDDVLAEPVPERLRDVLRRGPAAPATKAGAGTESDAAVGNGTSGRGKAHAGGADDAPANRRTPSSPPAGARRRRRPWLQAAAAVAIFLLGGMVGWSGNQMARPGVSEIDRVLDNASYAFSFYTSDRDYAVEFPPDRLEDFQTVSSRVFKASFAPPDLSEAGYTYRGARITPTGRRTGTLFFFEDQNDTSIGVLLWRTETPTQHELASRLIDEVSCWFWFAEGFGFAVLGPRDNGALDDIAHQLAAHYDQVFAGS